MNEVVYDMDFWEWLRYLRNHTDDARYYTTQSGVTLTIIINTIVSVILILMFIILCSHITLFNTSKKRKLFYRYLKRKQHRQETEPLLSTRARVNFNASDRLSLIPQEVDIYLNGVRHQEDLFSNPILRYVQIRWLFFCGVIRALYSPSYRILDQKQTMKSYGRDIAVYFYWQQLVIYAFSLITVLGLLVLLPLHMTGTMPQDLDQKNDTFEVPSFNDTSEYDLLRTSISMVITSPSKMAAHVVLSFLFLCIITLFLIIYFLRSKIVNKFNYLEHNEDFGIENEQDKQSDHEYHPEKQKEQTIHTTTILRGKEILNCPYTLEISGLRKDLLDQDGFAQSVRLLLDHPNNKYKSTVEDIIKVVLVYDFSKLVTLQKKLQEYEDMLDYYEYVWKKTVDHKRPVKSLWFKRHNTTFHIHTTVDAITYYRELRNRIVQKIKCWNESFIHATGQRIYSLDADSNIGKEDMPNISVVLGDNHAHKKYQIKGSSYAYIIFRNINALKDFKRNYHQFGDVSGWRAKLRTITYESQDINWENLFILQTRPRYKYYLQQFISILALFLILFFFSSPIALASTIQSILNLGTISKTIQWIETLSGSLGTLLFQYLPTLLLVIASALIPFIIIKLSSINKEKTYSKIQRSIMKSIFIYLIFSTLILPSVLLTSVDALVEFFVINANKHFTDALAKLFIPSNGAFFINYILQKATLSITLEVLQISTIIWYIWDIRFSSKLFRWTILYRPMTPAQKLKAAEQYEFAIEQEYPYMMSIVGISLCFSVFSPIILPVSLLYFVFKHLIDRYNIASTYGYKKCLYGDNVRVDDNDDTKNQFGMSFKSDFMSHRKMVFILIQFTLGNMLTMMLFQTLFFGSKVRSNGWFLIHAALCCSMFASCTVMIILWYILRKYMLNRNEVIDRMNYLKPAPELCNQVYNPPQLRPI